MGAMPRKDYVGITAKGTLTPVSAVVSAKATGTVVMATVSENVFATATATCATVLAGTTLTLNGLVYTAVAGVKADNTEFSIDTGDTACAVDLDDSISNDARVGTLGGMSATNSTGVVTVTTDVAGTNGNALTIVSSSGTELAVTGSGNLTGGVDVDTFRTNGLTYTAVAGAKADNTEFSTDTSDDATATDLADSITNDTRIGDSGDDVVAAAVTDTVTVTASTTGSGGNSIDLSSSNGTTLAVSGALLTGGADGDDVWVNGLKYTAVAGVKADDTEYSIDTSDAAAATDLADSIDDDLRVGSEAVTIASTASSGVVSIVSTGNRSHAVALLGNVNVSASGTFLTLGELLSNVDDNNQAYKQVNAMNSPFSIQSSGADKVDGRVIAVTTATIFNTLTVRQRVLWGNREGYISAHTASTSLIFTWLDKTKTKVNTTKTMAEVLASGTMVFLNENA